VLEYGLVKVARSGRSAVSGLSPQQEAGLRQLLEQRSAVEWDAKARRLDRALEGDGRLELSAAEYDRSLAAVIRLRLRRALMHALVDGAVSGPAAAQILGYVGHGQGAVELEDLLDPGRFPNLASDDFGFLRDIKNRLRWDLLKLKEAAKA